MKRLRGGRSRSGIVFPDSKKGRDMSEEFQLSYDRVLAAYLYRIYEKWGFYAANQDKYTKDPSELNILEVDAYNNFVEFMDEHGYAVMRLPIK